MAFQTAGRIGISEGLPQCQPVLLEPIHLVEIVCPNDSTAKINAILSGRRGQILGFDTREGWDGWDVVRAQMPEAEIGDLIIEVRSATAGVGTFIFKFDHMAELTGRTADQIVAAKAAAQAARCRSRTACLTPCSARASRDLPVSGARRSSGTRSTRGPRHERDPPPRLGNPRAASSRRSICSSTAAHCLAGAAAPIALAPACAARSASAMSPTADPTADLYPAKRNEKYVLDRPITDEKVNGNYNNFYEFGSDKDIAHAAQALPIRPWTVKIDGMVEKPIDHRHRRSDPQDAAGGAAYRHRCVEAWSMAIAWTGFPFTKLVDFASRSASAKYVADGDLHGPDVAPGQRQTWYPWPYIEGLTMAEATNELAFLATGVYGQPMPKQHGAPLRLAMPWKYGFKSVKSIVRFSFTDKRPKSFGRRCRRPNTASGPTSIRRCRIRAGARPPKR